MSASTEVTADLFGDVIHRNTRAQALDDGVLVDAGELAREAGFVIPVAVTRRVWDECVEVPEGAACQDETGRLWDVLFVARCTAQRLGGSRAPFTLRVVTTAGGQVRLRHLVVDCGPGDEGEPVITIMVRGES